MNCPYCGHHVGLFAIKSSDDRIDELLARNTKLTLDLREANARFDGAINALLAAAHLGSALGKELQQERDKR